MNLTNSLLRDLVTEYSNLRPQIYFKSSLLALARAMEDLVLASDDAPLVIANFQQESFFRQQEHRFYRIARQTDQVYVLAVPDRESGFSLANSGYETIPLEETDVLAGEKYLVIIGKQYSACLVGQEKLSLKELNEMRTPVEQVKRFEGFWTFDPDVTHSAADWLLGHIKNYRPELAEKLEQARQFYNLNQNLLSKPFLLTTQSIDVGIFTQRLVTYLQAGQYKLLKAYKAIAVAQRKEHLINKIAQAQRQSLNPQEILQITVRELGQLFPRYRCLLYRLSPNDTEVRIEHESVPLGMPSLLGQKWAVADNPIFIVAQTQDSALVINDVTDNIYLQGNPILKEKIERAAINSWLMVSIRDRGVLLGMLELHYGGKGSFQWQADDIALVEAVANSAGVALTQASAYTKLVDLNRQLETVERIQGNLIAIVGHELRTPLSTIRICLESLATEPDMPCELRESMLDMALVDSDRLSQLIQDFLTLSKLEAGKAYRSIEPLQLEYPIDIALRRIQSSFKNQAIPKIRVKLSHQLPLVMADVEGLVEVFNKLLDNTCKFTPAYGEIFITARIQNREDIVISEGSVRMLEVIIADTGRGIEPSQLEIIFDRFSQSENYLRRTVSGVGLGLVICRQIINGMGGRIWARSKGKDRGSQFHFTIPIKF
jgi:DICT domain-containing protein/nitrogen-specific signal transduction histidine kinase